MSNARNKKKKKSQTPASAKILVPVRGRATAQALRKNKVRGQTLFHQTSLDGQASAQQAVALTIREGGDG